MKYAVVFGLLALVLAGYAVALQGWAWLLLWPAVSFLTVSAAYAGVGPRLLGKCTDGRISLWALVLHLPYFLLTWGVWHGQRRTDRGAAVHEVVPGLWIGRRLLPRELPAGVTLVVDLTGEFYEPAGIRAGRTYVCLPTLDALAPPPGDLRRVAAEVAKWEGPVFIHCALGHGRTGLFAAAVLLTRGLAPDALSAVAMLRAVRPRLRLNLFQERELSRLVTEVVPRSDGSS